MKLTMISPSSNSNWVTFVMPNTFSIISINHTGLHRWGLMIVIILITMLMEDLKL